MPLGSNSKNFTCHGTGAVSWIINGDRVAYMSATETRLKGQGFEFYREVYMDHQQLNMTILASINTTISCKAVGDSVDTSEIARLIVIGEQACNIYFVLTSMHVLRSLCMYCTERTN